MDQDLNIKLEILTLIEEILGNSLELIGTGDNFINRTPMAQALRSIIDKWDLMKLQRFYKAMGTVNRTNHSPQVWKVSSPILHLTEGSYPTFSKNSRS